MGCGNSKNMDQPPGSWLRRNLEMEMFMDARGNDDDDDEEEEKEEGREVLHTRRSQISGDTDIIDSGMGPTYGIKPVLSVQKYLMFTESDEPQTEELSLHSPGKDPVFFKVKVSDNRRFVIKPVQGRIAPKSSVTVQVLLKPGADTDAYLEPERSLKLMVQSLHIANVDGDLLPQALWFDAPKENMGVDIVKVQIAPPPSEEVDFSKFMSVVVEVDNSRKHWWQH